MSYKSENVDKYKSLQSSLEKLQSDVSSELEQIRRDKIEIQSLKHSIDMAMKSGYFMRDEGRIIISAPEIIIGNVGRDGSIIAGGSTITLRGQDVNIEGVGAGDQSVGSVTTRAASISNIAVDPGIDGQESVVKSESSIFNLARNVVMQSEDAGDMFLYPASRGGSGVNIISDTTIDVNAMVACDSKKSYLSDLSTSLKSEKSSLTSDCSTLKSTITNYMSILDNLVMLYISPISSNSITKVTENQDMVLVQRDFDNVSSALYTTMSAYFDKASRLAEVTRQITSLESATKDINSKSSKMKSLDVNTKVNINSEYVGISSVDGDGNIRETLSSAFSVNARSINFTTQDVDKKQIVDSSIKMLSNKIEISTANPKVSESSSEYPAEGDVKIISKSISMESVDYKVASDKLEESLLTKSGSIKMRASTISVDTTSTDGTNDGMATINSKRVEVKGMDVDKDSRADKSITVGSEMLLNAEKMYVGGTGSTTESDNSKLLQLVSTDVGLFGSQTLEMQQGKAIVQLAGDKLSVSGSATAIYGATTMEADVTFSGKASGGSADFKCLDVGTAFTGPSISDGVGAAAGGGGGSLAAKLTQGEITAAPAKQSE